MSKYTNDDLLLLLEELRSYPRETTWLELKDSNSDPERIAKYISGLSNAACAANRDFGYLIWGIDDGTHEFTDTDFDPETKKNGNQPLSLWLKTVLKPEIGFEFYKLPIDGKKVVFLEIEAAYRQPIAFRNIPWIRIDSSLTELSKHPNIAALIYRTVGRDWTAEIIRDVTVESLDPAALEFARKQYSEKHKNDSFASEISNWDTITFLNKAKLAIAGQLTKATLLLLGKRESAHYLTPSVARITWNLLDSEDNSVDYHHFEPPFLLAVDQIFAKIRNITIRTMPDGTLFPIEISQYDSWVFREALHNCIAHQDYSLCRSIVVAEFPDHIQFANAGAFQPGTVENVLHDNGRPRYYPNKQLTEAMVELKMIDTIGSGIRRMFTTQKKRFMPMPDFVILPEEVRVILQGKILDGRYSLLLMKQTDLSLDEIILLDKIQKGIQIDKTVANLLRRRKLIEGRYPKIYPAARVAERTRQLEEYLDNKAYDDSFYIQKILEYLCVKGQASRADITKLLKKHLSSLMTEEQKERKIGNLLSLKMSKRKNYIINSGSRHTPSWILTGNGKEACKKANPGCKKECKKGLTQK